MSTMTTDDLPPDVAWAVAYCALENSKSLQRAAACLQANGHFGPALSLAITAREEFGKFVIAAHVAVEQSPGVGTQRDVRDHGRKQAAGAAFMSLGEELTKFAQAFGSRGPVSGHSVEDFIGAAVNRVNQVGSAVSWPSDSSAIEAAIANARTGADESRRRRGLYVDPSRMDGQWVVLAPSAISESESAREISALATVLSAFDSIAFGAEVALAGVPTSEDIELMRVTLTRFVASEVRQPATGADEA